MHFKIDLGRLREALIPFAAERAVFALGDLRVSIENGVVAARLKSEVLPLSGPIDVETREGAMVQVSLGKSGSRLLLPQGETNSAEAAFMPLPHDAGVVFALDAVAQMAAVVAPLQAPLPTTLRSLGVGADGSLEEALAQPLPHLEWVDVKSDARSRRITADRLPSSLRILDLREMKTLETLAVPRGSKLVRFWVEGAPSLHALPSFVDCADLDEILVKNLPSLTSWDFGGPLPRGRAARFSVRDAPRLESLRGDLGEMRSLAICRTGLVSLAGVRCCELETLTIEECPQFREGPAEGVPRHTDIIPAELGVFFARQADAESP